MIHAIAYVSSANERLLSIEALDSLLLDARQFNDKYKVTGVLLHNAGNFFQYFEGPIEGVNHVYDRIKRSKSHYGLIELLNINSPQRFFTEWSMGFAEPTSTELQQISHAAWMNQLSRISGSITRDNPGLKLLLDFWNRCQ